LKIQTAGGERCDDGDGGGEHYDAGELSCDWVSDRSDMGRAKTWENRVNLLDCST